MGPKWVQVCLGTAESRPEPLIEHLEKGPPLSALGAQVKAIHLCDQKGWSLTAPLLDLISGLTATEEGSLSGDPSLVKFSPANLESSEMGERSSFLPL